MYLYYYIVVKGRLCLYLFIHMPYHTRMNKSLVPEWPTFTDLYSFYCLLQLVIPTFLISHAAQRYTNSSHQCRAHCEQPFQDGHRIFRPCLLCSGFVLSVLLLSCTPATVSPISPWIVPHFRVFIANIRQVLTSFISPFALFRACCVVVESHSNHSFANFSVICSSFS